MVSVMERLEQVTTWRATQCRTIKSCASRVYRIESGQALIIAVIGQPYHLRLEEKACIIDGLLGTKM
jgi:NAD(P)H-hydrate repair Nnr-like enzyme with NAD(P)H-hydrate epimerase domain